MTPPPQQLGPYFLFIIAIEIVFYVYAPWEVSIKLPMLALHTLAVVTDVRQKQSSQTEADCD